MVLGHSGKWWGRCVCVCALVPGKKWIPDSVTISLRGKKVRKSYFPLRFIVMGYVLLEEKVPNKSCIMFWGARFQTR